MLSCRTKYMCLKAMCGIVAAYYQIKGEIHNASSKT